MHFRKGRKEKCIKDVRSSHSTKARVGSELHRKREGRMMIIKYVDVVPAGVRCRCS